ncbi:hypothetical protein SAMN05446935_10369 [Burkholderia sp. YR290]|nr:hypothetical protein SAMN05446935_4871 [Burkholderia sp. YR290]SOE91038.1 hypothetical protein SAMN05446935_10369 [Burkholderia sp. YR290]
MRPSHPAPRSNTIDSSAAVPFGEKLKACCAAVFNPLAGIERDLYAPSSDSADQVRIDPAILLLAALW